MPQANFAYAATAEDSAGLPLALSIYADRPHLRATIRDDAQAAGLRVAVTTDLAALIEGEARPLGDVVLVDCPVADAMAIAALARLDMRAANAGAQLVVSTTVDGLDAVFAVMDQSNPLILVDPDRAERVIALGEVLARFPARRLRELSEDDRLMILRLTEQVGQIAGKMERLASGGASVNGHAFAFAGASPEPSGLVSGMAADGPACAMGDKAGLRAARPPLPDPRLVRRIVRQRQLRARFLDGALFAHPAWDMLLDLTAARAEHARVSVTSLCIASGVPPTTALRWIGQMVEAGLFRRLGDDTDRRRAFIALSDKAADAMARYFAEIGAGAAALV
ncbi:MarR family transcriptional regulator [Novosphingobium album (ex Liu et al. 2023)]|uniref:MarR family transcriptional regulator n=1 Tax=Novosphingobium album (ex Liu et al. 2023) TaxID=3031130 RepID=A0ABT5WLH9_9SPHN|nr:MarR family transcriptional regulator [Novosphingobium album (ex Liu et al. 2023)]MDE8650902.1 MarR family transcriptional regulator [Novosphingobium album (ex Liu et al. 2023)]